MRGKTTLLLVATAWPLAVGGLAAQGVTTAALVGTVMGSDSTALEDAVVTVTNTATGERWQTATRARGSYVFEYLSVGGPYLLEVRAIGFSHGPCPQAGRARVSFRFGVFMIRSPFGVRR